MKTGGIDKAAPVSGVNGLSPAHRGKAPGKAADGASFNRILKDKLGSAPDIKFSGHAAERLQSRNIRLSPADKTSLSEAMTMAESKGAKESLVVYKDQILVVSVPNRTVITAVGKNAAEPKIFTNIDSAVIL